MNIKEYEEHNKKKTQDTKKLAIKVCVISGIIILLLTSWYIVPAGHRAVLLTFGQPDQVERSEGLHFKIPFAQRAVGMSIQTKKYVASASSASKDLQIVSTELAVNYHLMPNRVVKTYTEIGLNFEDKVIQPALQEIVKQITAKYTAEELITKRQQVKEDIDLVLKERLEKLSIVMETTSITNFDFSAEFNQAIEQKVTAEQLALKAERDLDRIKIEADQRIADAEGKAEAIRVESDALRNNPQVLELRALEKWDGVLPKVTGGAIPFINIE